ncbi:MAG: hypothetical protein SPD91_02625, partial [Streptococcus hyointestinalis]|uniref:hypothetical protein n=1 Tax=Streptococcus hyointestinalis TaxID=1337 RepID=UPI002A7F1CC2
YHLENEKSSDYSLPSEISSLLILVCFHTDKKPYNLCGGVTHYRYYRANKKAPWGFFVINQ